MATGVPAKVKIRCSGCRRVFHVVTEADYLRLPASRRPPYRRQSLRMTPVRDYATPAAPQEQGLALFQLRYTCHQRCGRIHIVGRDRYAKAVTAALAAGRGEVLLGLDC
jgi:hypothetical protein